LNTEGFFGESTEQSRVKAAIVRDYFWAWAKIILKKRPGRIAYVDLFAGPGRYKDGTKSTPLLVLEKAIADADMRERLFTIFNDANPENIRLLKVAIADLPGVETLKYQPEVDVGEVGDETARAFWKIDLVPTLLFADPWGYKGLSLDLISSFLKDWGCDCVFFFNYNRINPGLNNESVKEHMNALFGLERARRLREKLAGGHHGNESPPSLRDCVRLWANQARDMCFHSASKTIGVFVQAIIWFLQRSTQWVMGS